MIPLLFHVSVGLAAPGFESDTVAQIRHDLLGEPFTPVVQTVELWEEHQGVAIEGYGGMEWGAGIDRPSDIDLYRLQASGRTSWGGWRAGRQQAVAVIRPWTFDGVRGDWRPTPRLQLSSWGGIGRHQDLDDLDDGTVLGRVEGVFGAPRFVVRTGVTVQGGEEETSLQPSEDIEVRLSFAEVPTAPTVHVLCVFQGTEGPATWARAAVETHPSAHVFTGVHAEHREAQVGTELTGESLLTAFAPEGVDEVGGTVRLVGNRWASLSSSYALTTYEETENTAVFGHKVTVSFRPPASRSSMVFVPSYRFLSGSGGVYHAAIGVLSVPLSDATQLHLNGAVVPYRKMHEPWDTALALGSSVSRSWIDKFSVRAGLETARDADFALDIRGTVQLVVGGSR